MMSTHSVVGAAGFEPAISCSRSRRDTRLRYAPKSHHSAQHHLGSSAIGVNSPATASQSTHRGFYRHHLVVHDVVREVGIEPTI